MTWQAWTQADVDQLKALRADKVKHKDIARIMGRPVSAVQAKWGLLQNPKPSPESITKPAAIIKPEQRKCLCCGGRFMSEGPGNRICGGCTDTVNELSHMDGVCIEGVAS